MQTVLKAIFGTDAKMERDAEKQASLAFLTDVENKVERLDAVLNSQAHDLDEAMQQITESMRRMSRHEKER